METTREPSTTADDMRRKAAEYDERGDHETAEILRSVADEVDAEHSVSDRTVSGARPLL